MNTAEKKIFKMLLSEIWDIHSDIYDIYNCLNPQTIGHALKQESMRRKKLEEILNLLDEPTEDTSTSDSEFQYGDRVEVGMHDGTWYPGLYVGMEDDSYKVLMRECNRVTTTHDIRHSNR